MPFELNCVSCVNKKAKSSYPARRTIKILVLRNGVSSFKGIWFAVKIANYVTFKTLLSDLSIALKNKVFVHKGGVQSLFSTDGCKITSVEKLDDGQSYVVSFLNEKFIPIQQLNSRPASTAHHHLSVKQTALCDKTGSSSRLEITPAVTKTGRSRPTSAPPTRSRSTAREPSTSRPIGNVKPNKVRTERTASSDGNRKIFSRTTAQSSRPSYIKNQWITVLHHGIKPRISYRILLDRTTPNFTSVMNKIIVTLKLSSEAKVFSDKCLMTSRYEDFFQDSFIFVAFQSTSIQWEDFDLHTQEEKNIEKQNSILRFGLKNKVSLDNLPMCISSKYNVSETLSYGCFSLLIRCCEKSTDRNFALKVTHKMPGNEVMEASLKRNRAGVDFLSFLKNSNILATFFQQETISAHYIIVEYCNGGDLHRFIERSPRILEEEVWNFIGDIMCALRYLHSVNIVHRNICTASLLVNINHDGSRQLKLFDFCLATRMTDEPLSVPVGFLLYMAPEMIERRYGLKVDVWGAGVTLYYILTQTLPFLSTSVQESRRMILTSDGVPCIGAEWEATSASMKSLIRAMMEHNESRRLTAEDVCEVIRKHNVELDINLPREEEQEPLEKTTTTSEPENIDTSSVVEKWIDTSEFIQGDSKLSNIGSEQEMKQSNTTEPGITSSHSSVELSCMSLLSSTCSFRSTCESNKLFFDSCSVQMGSESSNAREEVGIISTSGVPDDQKEHYSCPGLTKEPSPDHLVTEVHTLDRGECEHHGVNEGNAQQKQEDVNHQRNEDENLEAIGFEGFGDNIFIQVGDLQSVAYKDCRRTESESGPETVVYDEIVADFRRQGYMLMQQITEREITGIPNDPKEYSSCPGIETEHSLDMSETEVQTLDGGEYDHHDVNVGPHQQKVEDVNHQRTEDEHVEAIDFQGFGDEMIYTISIQVGVLQSEAYQDCETSEPCPGAVVDDEIVEEFRSQGYKLLQQIPEEEL